MSAPGEDPSFLGRGWSFPPRFDSLTGKLVMVSATDDIAESLRILFLTAPGERIMHPTYGCALRQLVFEPMTPGGVSAIQEAISRAILFFEPRIQAVDVTAQPVDWPQGKLLVMVGYRVIATNTRHNIVFPFYLEEGTLLSATPEARP